MGFQLLIFGIWLLKCCISPQTNSTTSKIKYEETRRVTPHQISSPKTKPMFQPSTTILIWAMLTMCRRTRSLLDLVRCWKFEDNEGVIKIIIKGRSPTMRHAFRTHRVAIDWLFDRINLDLKMARGMGSPRQVLNRRRRTREGPEAACVQTPWSRMAHAGRSRRI